MTRTTPLAALVVLTLAVACGGSAPTVTTPTPRAAQFTRLPRISQPCTLTPVARALDVDGGFPSVYVELAAVALSKASALPIAGQRPAGFLNTEDLQVLRLGSVTAKVGASATMPWDEAPASDASASRDKQSRFDLTLIVHSVDLQRRQVKLEVAIVPAPPLGTPKDAWYVPEHRQLRTTVIVGDQQPLMLGGESMSHRDTPSVLVATPYILSVPEHLNELFQCRLAAMAKVTADATAR